MLMSYLSAFERFTRPDCTRSATALTSAV